jgi:plastocyanin
MKRNTWIMVAVVVVVIIAVVGLVMAKKKNTTTSTTSTPSSTTQTPSDTTQTPSSSSSASSDSASQGSSVAIQDMNFSPATLTVKKGTTVTWTNKDSVAHTVTVDSGAGPNSGNLDSGKTYSYTFDTAGTFNYHCQYHSNMVAKVVVTE